MKRIVLTVITALILFTACGSDADKLTANRWDWGGEDILEFFDDGTYDWGGWGSGTYSINDDRLKLDRKYHGTWIYTFEFDGDTLILYQNDSTNNVFKLKKIK